MNPRTKLTSEEKKLASFIADIQNQIDSLSDKIQQQINLLSCGDLLQGGEAYDENIAKIRRYQHARTLMKADLICLQSNFETLAKEPYPFVVVQLQGSLEQP
jgi:hypothetical protein